MQGRLPMAGDGRRAGAKDREEGAAVRQGRAGRLQEEMRKNLLKRKRQQRQRAEPAAPSPPGDAGES
jgi:hypothetical protein